MKRKRYFIILLLLVCMLAGCKEQEKEEIELLPASQERFCYEGTEGVEQLAADENGTLYTIRHFYSGVSLDDGTEVVGAKNCYQEVCVYDLEGNCIRSQTLEAGNATASVMTVKDEVVYFVARKSAKMNEYNNRALFAINTVDWTVTLVKELPKYKDIHYMVIIGDYAYMLGVEKQERFSQEEIESLDDGEYVYRNYRVIRLNITEEDPELEWMAVDFPISLYRTGQDTLMVCQYSREKERCFLEFHPEKLTLTENASKMLVNESEIMLCGCGDGYLFRQMDDKFRYFIYYGTLDGREAQVLPDNFGVTSVAMAYQKGFAFFLNASEKNSVERICLENVVQDNKTLQVIRSDISQELPFGCGYLMENRSMASDAFALKVLAGDSDFDILLLNSGDSVSYNIKEKGAFYPLNEIEGVQEYLNACFPYIEEIATDEDGAIWMLPVRVSIPVLSYNRAFCKENGVKYADMDWMDFISFIAASKEETEDLTDVSLYVLLNRFFGQYLAEYDSFDTEVFRTCAKQLREVVQEQGDWWFNFKARENVENGIITEYLCTYHTTVRDIWTYTDVLGESDLIGLAEVPKLSEDSKNVGTISFLAVNPQSKNLETALEYMSAFAKYMVTKQDSYLLTDESMYTDTPFVKEAYELYADADIYFMMDFEIFRSDFVSYLNGEMELEEMIAEIERKYQLYMGE